MGDCAKEFVPLEFGTFRVTNNPTYLKQAELIVIYIYTHHLMEYATLSQCFSVKYNIAEALSYVWHGEMIVR